MLLSGIFAPVTTPFYPDGKVYYKKLEANIEHYSKTPLAGIVIHGSTGEAILLSDEERREVLKTAITSAAAEKVMIAGCGIESAIETLRLTEYAATLGYDLAMIRTPHYYKGQMNRPENMLAFYRTVADRSPLPLVIYNFPQATGYDIPAEIVVQLAEHPNIVAIKESSGVLEKVALMVEKTRHIKRAAKVTERFEPVTGRMMKKARSASVGAGGVISVEALGAQRPSSSAVEVVGNLKTRPKEVAFQVMVGSANKLLASLDLGATGAILAFADPAPTACYEIYAAFKDGDKKLAQEKQARIAEAAVRIVSDMSIPAVKYAMDLNGYYGGTPRLPLLPLTGDAKAEVERLMADIRN